MFRVSSGVVTALGDDPDKCLAAPDAASFAIEHGFYNGTAHDQTFSFSASYWVQLII